MNRPDDIFLLIKSMTGAEKRYFKLFSALYNRDKSYIKLFNLLAKQKINYNENELISAFKKEKWAKNLSNTKYELFNAILNSMEVFHKNDSVEAKLASLMNHLNLLHQKNLFRAAKKVIVKIEKLATKHEMHHYLLMVNSVKVIIMTKELNLKEIDRYVSEARYEVEQMHLNCLENNSEFLNLNLRISKAVELFFKTKDTKELIELSKSRLLKSPDMALTFYARRNYYYLNYMCKSKFENQSEEVYLQQKEWIDYLEREKDLLPLRAGIYLATIIRYLAATNAAKHRTESEHIFTKAKNFYNSLPNKMRTENINMTFAGIASNYIEGQINIYMPQNSVAVWKSVDHLVSDESVSGEWYMVISANLSYAHFLLEEYRKANKYLNKLLNYTGYARPDIQAFARMYSLFLNYELGNYDLLASICQTSKRYLQKHKFFGKYESYVIRFFRKDIFKLSGKDDKTIFHNKLRADFIRLLPHSKTGIAQKIDIVSWIESKVYGCSFLHLLRERSEETGAGS